MTSALTSYDCILLETDARGVAWLTLNRPEKHNALSAKMIAELTDASIRIEQDKDLRVVVIKAAGKSFCAGADLDWMRTQMQADAQTRAAEARKLAQMLGALNALSKPVISCLEGNAFGGGVGIASVSDVSIAASHIKMALTEVKLGLIPATIGPYVIARMGEAKARQVFMSGRPFDAHEGRELGLVTKVVELEDMTRVIEAEIAPYLLASPEAVARAKRLALRFGSAVSQAEIDHSIEELVACWESDDAKEGVAAFFDKRKAAWVR